MVQCSRLCGELGQVLAHPLDPGKPICQHDLENGSAAKRRAGSAQVAQAGIALGQQQKKGATHAEKRAQARLLCSRIRPGLAQELQCLLPGVLLPRSRDQRHDVGSGQATALCPPVLFRRPEALLRARGPAAVTRRQRPALL